MYGQRLPNKLKRKIKAQRQKNNNRDRVISFQKDMQPPKAIGGGMARTDRKIREPFYTGVNNKYLVRDLGHANSKVLTRKIAFKKINKDKPFDHLAFNWLKLN